MNLAVAYTEYQLLQIEAVISCHKLKNVMLIVHNKNNRVPQWLIDETLFESVVHLPLMQSSKLFNLSKKYIRYYSSVIFELIQNRKINILIGAQDDNTIFALIKSVARPSCYWNIEDGSSNYQRNSFRYIAELFLKKMLFSCYGYTKLDIRYGHGRVKADKAFRLYPKLNVGTNDCVYFGDCLGNYLKEKVKKIRAEITWIDQYKCFDTMVVSDVSLTSDILKKHRANELYKFHPENRVELGRVPYVKEKIPIEFLPLLLNNIKIVRYDIYSSSILNMLVLNFDVRIQVNYLPPNSVCRFYIDNIVKEFGDRIEVLQCWTK